MNIVFLDIDGVLNSATSCIGQGMSQVTENPTESNLSVPSVGILRYMCEQIGDYGIYLHSSWAKWNYVTDEYVKKMLEHHGFPDANVLPIFQDTVYSNREMRINKTIQRLTPDEFIVLDDFNMKETFGNKQVLVDSHIGLSYISLYDVRDVFSHVKIPIVLL